MAKEMNLAKPEPVAWKPSRGYEAAHCQREYVIHEKDQRCLLDNSCPYLWISECLFGRYRIHGQRSFASLLCEQGRLNIWP